MAIPLSKAVFLLCNQNADLEPGFLFAKRDLIHNDLLLKSCMQTLIVKKNSEFFVCVRDGSSEVRLSFHVLDCIPFTTGCIKYDTELAFLDFSSKCATCAICELANSEPENGNGSVAKLTLHNSDLLNSMCTCLGDGDYSDYDLHGSLNDYCRLCGITSECTSESNEASEYFFEFNKKIDSLFPNQTNRVSLKFHVKHDNHCIDGFLISPLTVMKLHCLSSPENISLDFESLEDIPHSQLRLKQNLSHVCYAAKVSISAIKSPYSTSSDTVLLDEQLKLYFSQKRLLSDGTVFQIRLTPYHVPVNLKVIDHELHENEFTSPYPDQFYVDTSHTTLVQVTDTNWYCPPLPPTSFEQHSIYCDPPAYFAQLRDTICDSIQGLISNSHSQQLSSDVIASFLLIGPDGCGKSLVPELVSRKLFFNLKMLNCYQLISDTSAALESKIKTVFEEAKRCVPSILYLENFHVICKDKETDEEDLRVTASLTEFISEYCGSFTIAQNDSVFPLVFIASVNERKQLPETISRNFCQTLTFESLSLAEREGLLHHFSPKSRLALDCDFHYLAQHTAGFLYADLVSLVQRTISVSNVRVEKYLEELAHLRPASISTKPPFPSDVVLTQADFLSALQLIQALSTEKIEAAKIPQVRWEDIGGLEEAKKDILETIELPMKNPNLFQNTGLSRSGLLLYGAPGTGKTLLAKAVATECSLNFIGVKGPELINMYVGQSEQNVRDLFSRARAASPCVIFFDELDSLAPNRGRSGDSGGVMDRVVSQLLAELDGMTKSADVYVIGATNRPDLVDPALLRPGRFDKLIYVDVCRDRDSRISVMKALTRKLPIAPSLDVGAIVDTCPSNMTGADFSALCSDASMNAIRTQIQALEEGSAVENEANLTLELTIEDFMGAIVNLTPSVNEQDLSRYQDLKNAFAVAHITP